MNWRIAGPILFASMLFAIELSVKGVAFDRPTIWFELGPSLAFWATGVLFSLAVSEQTQLRGAIEYQAARKPGGTGFDLEYQIRLPDRLDFTPRYLYLFVLVLTLWILSLLVSQDILNTYALAEGWTPHIQLLTAVSVVLGGTSVSIGLLSLAEVGG